MTHILVAAVLGAMFVGKGMARYKRDRIYGRFLLGAGFVLWLMPIGLHFVR